MINRTANLLGALALEIPGRIEATAREILNHAGETPAAIVVIGYGFGPSNEELRRVLGLSHPGSVRLIDRLVTDGLVERRKGRDRRAIALYLTEQGHILRKKLLKGRLAAIRAIVDPLSASEQTSLDSLLGKMLSSMEPTDAQRCSLCRLCDDSVCVDCPIPANFRNQEFVH
jgi:MarR family transcriptional regulator, negative regulator of the multidrug operon emrRAB